MIKPIVAVLLLTTQSDAAIPDGYFNCTGGPLVSVTYGNRYCNPDVTCGTIMLKPDIQTEPLFKFAGAESSSLYALFMIDPDGNINGSWPGPPPGDVAPVGDSCCYSISPCS
jgi:hypothetical protein